MKTRSKRWPYVACVVLQTVIFGSGNAITKMAYESITPMWCLAIRFGLAALVFAIFFGPRIVRQLKGARIGAWMPAALCMALAYLTCNVALDLTTATNVASWWRCPWCSRAVVVPGEPPSLSAGLPAVPGGGRGRALPLVQQRGSSFVRLGRDPRAAVLRGVGRRARVRRARLGAAGRTTVAGTQIVASFVVALACALVSSRP